MTESLFSRISIFARSRNLRLFSTSILDQGMLSLGNFALGFLLIRHTTDVDYGLFVLVQSGITLLAAAQGAWLAGPLMVVAPHKSPELKLEMIGSLERSQRRFVSLVTLVAFSIPLVAYASGWWSGIEALVATTGLFAGWIALVREYSRSVLLIFSKPHLLLYADMVYVGLVLAGAIFAAAGIGSAALASVAALVVAGAGGWFAAHHFIAKSHGWHKGSANAGRFWDELRPLGVWATIGSVIYWIYSQSYNFVLASRLDLSAVADVNAARLLLMPAFILTIGIKSLLTPLAANWLAKDGVAAMVRRAWFIVPFVMIMSLVYIAMVWFGQDFLTTRLLQKVIHDRETLIFLWSTIVVIALTREVLQSVVIVLGQLRALAWLGAACAAVSLPVMWFGIARWGPAAPLIGQACGEAISLAGTLWLLPRAAARYRQSNWSGS
jgi:O-antigen/teichoic acid export membrane protein